MDFEGYVAARGQSLLQFAYLLTRDHHAAEDVVQSALADAYRHWSKVSRAEHPDAYVHRMILNTFIKSRRRFWRSEVPSENLPEEPSSSTSSATAIVDSRDQLRVALAELAPRARAVLVLRYWLDMDDVTIARQLGISPSSVRASASRALAALREKSRTSRDAFER